VALTNVCRQHTAVQQVNSPQHSAASSKITHQQHRSWHPPWQLGLTWCRPQTELCQVLDGVDVMVRGRADEGHTRLAAAQVWQ